MLPDRPCRCIDCPCWFMVAVGPYRLLLSADCQANKHLLRISVLTKLDQMPERMFLCL